jgi:hypothetical protein
MFTRATTGQTQETSSDNRLSDLPHTRPDHPQVRPSFFSRSAVREALLRLTRIHLRITLCRISLGEGWDTAVAAARALEDSSLFVDVRDDGSILLLWAGPRGKGAEGDRHASEAIMRRLRRLLGEVPELAQSGLAKVSLVHCWSDALDVATGLSDSFVLAGEQPVESMKLAAA